MNNYNPNKIEKKWQERWEKEKTYEANPSNEEKFFLTVPYPYTSGPLHIGHGRTYTLGDIFARFKRMQGYNVLWPMAFHMTGTPVHAISQQIKKGNKEKIELFKDYVKIYEENQEKAEEIVESFKDPYKVAEYFANAIHKDFRSLGYSIDWRRQFTTGDEDYQKFVEWQFHKYKEKGYLEQGNHPILYCTECENAVGEDDIKDGDRIKAEIETFTGIKYPYKEGYLVASTLRPETIFGVTNLFINPKTNYVKADVNGETWYISKKSAEKLERQGKKVKIQKKIKGKEIIGNKTLNPITKEELPIITGEFVDPDNATGVVYSVPAHAPYDYVALKEKGDLDKVKIKSIIETPGYGEHPAKEEVEKLGIKTQAEKEKLKQATTELYKKEFHKGKMKVKHEDFQGLTVEQAKEKASKWLKKQGKATEIYEVTSKTDQVHCRCGGKVTAVVMENQWFLNYGKEEWKQKAKRCLESMNIKPEIYREQFKNIFEWIDKRPCARKRGIGTKFPFQENWIIESLSDSTIYMAFYTIKNHLKNIEPNQLTQEFWDHILLDKGTPKKTSQSTGIPEEQINTVKKEFNYWYPNDQRHTAIAHLSNHLSFFIFAHAAIFTEKNWPKTITLNELLIREGTKMSKSKGNVIPLTNITKKYSADLFRAYIASAADMESVLDWREEEAKNMDKKLRKLHEETSKTKKGTTKPKEEDLIDQWLSAKINTHTKNAQKALEEYKVREYVQNALLNTQSTLKEYKNKKEKPNKELINHVTDKVLKINYPLIPHLCEELWEQKGHQTTLTEETWPQIHKEDLEKEKMMEVVDQVTTDIRQIQKITGIKKPRKIEIYTAPEWKRKAHRLMQKTKENIIGQLMKDEDIKKHGKEAVTYAKHLQKNKYNLPKEVLTQKQEQQALKSLKQYIEKQFKSQISIKKAQETKEPKAQKATPMKPAIKIEK